jgi:GNAT superfamily N-acetyltransferase
MRVEEIINESRLGNAVETAQRMYDKYAGLNYTAYDRAVDHSQNYESNTPQYQYWMDVAREIDRLERADTAKKKKSNLEEARIRYEDLVLDYRIDGANVDVRAIVDDKQVGYVIFNRDGRTLFPDDLAVDAEYRGRGIAKKMYDWVKSLPQKFEIIRGDQTAMGKRFWDKNRGEHVDVWEEDVAEDTVDEMALASYKTLGDFDKPGGFRGVDKRLVPHPKSELKAAKFFEQTPYDFRLFFANKPGLGQYQEYGPMTPDQIVKVFGEEDAKTILDNHDDAITVVYVSNRGDEKVMMTPWIMAHRFGHAIQAGTRRDKWSAWQETEKIFFSTVNRLLDEYYGKVGSVFDFRKADQPNYNLSPEYNALFNAIGTQRSSRTGQIRRPYEFMYELFAQYLGTGTITLNPLPTNLGYGRKVFGNPSKYLNIKPEFRDETELRQASEMLARDMELMFNDVLGNSVGQVYVM